MYQGYYDCHCKKERKKKCCKKEKRERCKKPCMKCCKRDYCCDYEYKGQGYGNIYSLIILILVVCQFCKKDKGESHAMIDNSILFIITLFLLVYCSGCKGMYGYDADGGYDC